MKIETKFSIGDVVEAPTGFLDVVSDLDVTVYDDGSIRVVYHLQSGKSYDEGQLSPDTSGIVCDHCGKEVESDGLGVEEARHVDTRRYHCDGSNTTFAEVNGTDKWRFISES